LDESNEQCSIRDPRTISEHALGMILVDNKDNNTAISSEGLLRGC